MLRDVDGGDILIYGLGRSGRGVARFLSAEGLEADWFDQQPTQSDSELMNEYGFEYGSVADNPDLAYNLVVAAPGVPIDHPDLLALQQAGAEIVGEVAIAARHRPAVELLGITGTAGKGSTTFLASQLLQACDLRAEAGGNIDPPLLDVIERAEIATVELSSFQLERIAGTRFKVAVITNLGVDHLDRHKTIQSYHAAKWNICANQQPNDVLIVPRQLLSEAQVRTAAKVLPFSPQCLALSDGTQIARPDELPASQHPANVAAALLLAEAFLQQQGKAVQPQVLRQALLTARPFAGRFECVAQTGAIGWIDDSIATRTTAVLAALERVSGPVVWLVGGIDKGADLAPLRAAARGKVIKVVAFGQDGSQLASQLGLPTVSLPYVPHTPQQTMQAVVRQAYELLADQQTGTVLLAPIGTSFDLFNDYKHRGQCFKDAIFELQQSLEQEPTA